MGTRNTIIHVPSLKDEAAMRQFLLQLATKLDVVFSARSDEDATATVLDLTTVQSVIPDPGRLAEENATGLTSRLNAIETRLTILES